MDLSHFAFFIVAFSSFFSIVNPLSTAPVFLSISRGTTQEEKRLMARKACIATAAVLLVFGLAGSVILSFFNITVHAFSIAGGILIAVMGMQMLHGNPKEFKSRKAHREAVKKEDVSLIPLAIPLLAGPGAMTTAIVLAGRASSPVDILSLIAAIILIAIVSYVTLREAPLVLRFLGENGLHVAEKVMGLIVLVIGVQFVINGIGGLLSIWGFL